MRVEFLSVALLSLTALVPLAAEDGGSDAAWQHIQDLRQQLSGDAPVGVNEVEFAAPIKRELQEAAADFIRRHPLDPHRWDAAILELKTVQFPTPVAERRAVFEQQERLLNEIGTRHGAFADATPEQWQQAERTLISQHLDHLDLIDKPEEAAVLEARIIAYLHEHPDDKKANAWQVRRVDLLQRIDPKKATDLLVMLSRDSDLKVAEAARGRLELRTAETTPLDWKFTAVDGRPVDLAAWRGKVVLVDFWASWCPDCLREMPDVQAAYRKYHEQGFEVVGVSMDRDKAAMLNFLKKHDIPWPQQYDGQAWDSSVAVKYGVKGIPEMWLLDRAGKVTATGVHGSQLEAKLRPLL